MDDKSYEYLKMKILKLTNINLDNYKSQQMRRRLNMFFEYSKFDNIVSYVAALEKNPELLKKLQDFLTINVSEFFRDRSPFDNLKNVILPELLRKNPALNIWSAGCSRGEEPYSVAMILNSLMSGQKHRILATDIDENSLKKARDGGPYSITEMKNVPPSMLSRWFECSADQGWVSGSIRSMVEVRRHDLLNDEFERGFDLIICRNVVIYFTDQTKRLLNEKFLKSLKSGGILFIGGTEVMLDSVEVGFEQIGPFFYRKPDSGIKKMTASQTSTLSMRP